jgi:hypothetical protein
MLWDICGIYAKAASDDMASVINGCLGPDGEINSFKITLKRMPCWLSVKPGNLAKTLKGNLLSSSAQNLS